MEFKCLVFVCVCVAASLADRIWFPEEEDLSVSNYKSISDEYEYYRPEDKSRLIETLYGNFRRNPKYRPSSDRKRWVNSEILFPEESRNFIQSTEKWYRTTESPKFEEFEYNHFVNKPNTWKGQSLNTYNHNVKKSAKQTNGVGNSKLGLPLDIHLQNRKRQSEWNSADRQIPNRPQRRPQGNQRPRPTSRPRTTTTTMATSTGVTSSTTPSARQQDCERNCPTTPEFNPVCATNGNQFFNMGRLRCSQRCGSSLQLVHYGSCSANLFPASPPPTTSTM